MGMVAAISSCATTGNSTGGVDDLRDTIATIGRIEKIEEAFNDLVNDKARIEIIATGFEWTEGPLWIDSLDMLLFTDVPANTVHKWTADSGAVPYLNPSGYTGDVPLDGETGANGLLLDTKGRLVLCQHGDRRLAEMGASLTQPQSLFKTLAATYENKKLNSPNDLAQAKDGTIYFTDPPYGLGEARAAEKELDFHGLYRLGQEGRLSLLADSLTRPNGLAITPDEKQLIVANSDRKKPFLYAFDLLENGMLNPRGVVYDFTPFVSGNNGLPDGLKIDRKGNIFTTGPGGIWILDKDYALLGKIHLPQAASNCYLSKDNKTLFITATDKVLRLKMR